MAERIPPHGRQHPEQYRTDLHPDAGRDPNVAPSERPLRDEPPRTAYDDKNLHARLSGWSDADLKRIPLAPEGEVLRQGGTYLDLGTKPPEEFTALANSHVKADDCYVAKQDVDHELWNRLLALGTVRAPERGDDGAPEAAGLGSQVHGAAAGTGASIRRGLVLELAARVPHGTVHASSESARADVHLVHDRRVEARSHECGNPPRDRHARAGRALAAR